MCPSTCRHAFWAGFVGIFAVLLLSEADAHTSTETVVDTNKVIAHTGLEIGHQRCLEDLSHELDNEHDSLPAVKETARDVVLPISIGLLVSFVLASIPESLGISFIPESLIIILVGLVFGFWIKEAVKDQELDEHLFGVLNATVLNLFLLPLIIFESGWSLRVHDFAAEFIYILMFAVGGTIIAWVFTMVLLHASGDVHDLYHWRSAATFSALIVATDPVATLSTYAALKVEPLLNIMVFGESMINDAVAITLFKTLNDNKVMGDPAELGGVSKPLAEAIGPIIVGILVNFFGSLALGVGLAIIVILVMRIFHLRHSQPLETLFVVITPFMVYALAETVEMSGIIANLFFSTLMGIYGRGNLSRKGNLLTSFFIKQAALLMDTGVFFLIGLDAAIVDMASGSLFVWTFFIIILARAMSTLLVGWTANSVKAAYGTILDKGKDEWNLLSPAVLFMMWHAGLRGGIALVLALELGDWVDVEEGEGTKEEIVGTTILVIVAFLILFGGTTECALKCTGIETGKDVDPNALFDAELAGCEIKAVRWVHRKVLLPILVGEKRNTQNTEEGVKGVELEEVLEESNLNYRHYKKHPRKTGEQEALQLADESSSAGDSDEEQDTTTTEGPSLVSTEDAGGEARSFYFGFLASQESPRTTATASE